MRTRGLSPDTRLRLLRAALVAALFVCGATHARAQDDEAITVESNLVQLNVGVADRRGRAVTDLTRADFVIYEDGVRQSITNFEPVNAPFSLVLLLDTSGSTLSFRTTLKQSALRFIDALGPDDRIAVVSFNEKIKTLQAFTTDRKKIAYAINGVEGAGRTNLYSALTHSLRELSKEGKRRKAVVVITDGKDSEQERADRSSASAATTGDAALAAVKPEQSAPLRAALDMADRQGVTVYPLALPSGDLRLVHEPTPQQVAVYTAARARLQSLANRTGGRLHEIRRLEDMGRLYAEVAADMRTLYTIAYAPSGERRRDGSWRAIQIEVSRADLIARTRPGYYAR
jgi:Ca-activated chloride channel family protein